MNIENLNGLIKDKANYSEAVKSLNEKNSNLTSKIIKTDISSLTERNASQNYARTRKRFTIKRIGDTAENALANAEYSADEITNKSIFSLGKSAVQVTRLVPQSLRTTQNTIVSSKNFANFSINTSKATKDVMIASYLYKHNKKGVAEREDLKLAKDKLKDIIINRRQDMKKHISSKPGITESMKNIINNSNGFNSDDIGIKGIVKTKDTVMKSSATLRKAAGYRKKIKNNRAVKKARKKIYKKTNGLYKSSLKISKQLFSNPVVKKILLSIIGAGFILALIASVIVVIVNIVSNLDFLNHKTEKEESTYSQYLEIIDTEFFNANNYICLYANSKYNMDLPDDYLLFNNTDGELINQILAFAVVNKQEDAEDDVILTNSDIYKYLIDMTVFNRTISKYKEIIIKEGNTPEENETELVCEYLDETEVKFNDLLKGNEFPYNEHDGAEGYSTSYQISILPVNQIMDDYNFTVEEIDRQDLIIVYFDEQYQDILTDFIFKKERERNAS